MQVSDEELLDDSQLKMTLQDSSMERNMQNVESVSVQDRGSRLQGHQPEISIQQHDQQPHSAQNGRTVPRADDKSNLKYMVTKDRYVGGIDPVTKLRHGQGTYTYTNPYF